MKHSRPEPHTALQTATSSRVAPRCSHLGSNPRTCKAMVRDSSPSPALAPSSRTLLGLGLRSDQLLVRLPGGASDRSVCPLPGRAGRVVERYERTRQPPARDLHADQVPVAPPLDRQRVTTTLSLQPQPCEPAHRHAGSRAAPAPATSLRGVSIAVKSLRDHMLVDASGCRPPTSAADCRPRCSCPSKSSSGGAERQGPRTLPRPRVPAARGCWPAR